MQFILITFDTSHFEMSPLKDVALLNMLFVVVTLDTSHFEMSPINRVAYEKRVFMLPMLDTSHSAIGPCGPLGQSPVKDNSRHASTALLSSDLDGLFCSYLDCGENAETEGRNSRAEF